VSAARRKGTRGETAVVEFLRASGWPHTEPEWFVTMTGSTCSRCCWPSPT